MRKAMEKSDGSSSLKGWFWESNVVFVGTCRVYAKKDIERQHPQRCTHTTMIFCQALPKCIPISKSPGVQAKVGGDHIETARSKRWGDFGSKQWRVKTALVHWNAVTSWTLVAIPTSNCTSQATNWNWLANRGTEVLGVLLSRRPWGFSQPRSVEKAMSLCAKENKKSFEQKSNTSSSAILPKAMPEPQLGPPGPPVLHAWLHDTGLAKQGLEEALEVYQDTWICYQQIQAKKWKQMKISSASQKWRLSCVELRWVLQW